MNNLSPLFRSFISLLETGLIFSNQADTWKLAGVSGLVGDFSWCWWLCSVCDSRRVEGSWVSLAVPAQGCHLRRSPAAPVPCHRLGAQPTALGSCEAPEMSVCRDLG